MTCGIFRKILSFATSYPQNIFHWQLLTLNSLPDCAQLITRYGKMFNIKKHVKLSSKFCLRFSHFCFLGTVTKTMYKKLELYM